MRHSVACVVLVVLALTPIAGSSNARPILGECNNHKANPDALADNAHALVDEVVKLVRKDPSLREYVEVGGYITERIYDAGLIGRVPGCIHQAGKPNIEVVGGALAVRDAPSVGGVPPGSRGVTLIIRALPKTHCEALKSRGGHGRRGRYALVRFEPPDKPPHPFGACFGNPVASFLSLGKNLPQPNTAYIFQEIALTSQRACVPGGGEICCESLTWDGRNGGSYTKLDNALKIIRDKTRTGRDMLNKVRRRGAALQVCRGMEGYAHLEALADALRIKKSKLASWSEEELIRTLLEELAHATTSVNLTWPNPTTRIADNISEREFQSKEVTYLQHHEAVGWLRAASEAEYLNQRHRMKVPLILPNIFNHNPKLNQEFRVQWPIMSRLALGSWTDIVEGAKRMSYFVNHSRLMYNGHEIHYYKYHEELAKLLLACPSGNIKESKSSGWFCEN